MGQKITYDTYYDKVLGGWVGKCAGGILGAPIEGFKHFNTISYSDKLFETNFANDDLDLQVLWLDMILKKGKKIRGTDFKEHWKAHVDFPWCEYGIAKSNISIGLDIPDTGSHNNWYWRSGMGSPIRSEIWGMVNPGQPSEAAFFARLDSSLDHDGFSVQAEEYLSACASIAFFESNLKTILTKGLNYIDRDNECYQLVEKVFDWNEKFGFEISMHKIKSYYGDADFTNAQMNIAFTILSLLNSGNSFDFLIDTLRLGHDSDCIVATAGALMGIAQGYKAIPDQWKKRVGNELLVSPEIFDIYCPSTLTELTELTCRAGSYFQADTVDFQKIHSDHSPSAIPNEYDLYIKVLSFPVAFRSDSAHIRIVYENMGDISQKVKISLGSSIIKSQTHQFTVDQGFTKEIEAEIIFDWSEFNPKNCSIPYKLDLVINDQDTIEIDKGLPYYGNWMLLGPFIEDDPALVQSTFKFPDHGMSSLPSVTYMNQDKARPEKEFVSSHEIQKLLNEKLIFNQGYGVELIHPQEMRVNLGNYFCGKGERTVYLYSEIDSFESCLKWLTLGAAAYLTIWLNEKQIYKNNELVRSYPLAHAVEMPLEQGRNSLLIRLDFTLDDFHVEVGIKEHGQKHPHQSQWTTDLQFNIADRL